MDLRNRVVTLFLLLITATSVAQTSLHSVGGGVGWCLPNTEEWSYVSSPTATLSYSRYLGRVDGGLFGLRGDVLAALHPIAGTRFSVGIDVETPLISRYDGDDEYRLLSWVWELGLACYTEPYKRTMDDFNEFIGSYLNCHIGLAVRYRLNRRWVVALRFAHSSNGYLKKPNQGLNYLQLECAYGFGQTSPTSPTTETIDTTAGHCYLSYAPGLVLQRAGGSNTHYYYAHTLQMGRMWKVGHSRYVGGNLDFMFNYTHRAEARQAGNPDPFPMYVGICGGYERHWNPLMMRVSIGTYLLCSEYVGMRVYEHVGIFYRMGRRLHQFVGVGFKAHYAHVDYIEWTYGIEF